MKWTGINYDAHIDLWGAGFEHMTRSSALPFEVLNAEQIRVKYP